MNILKILNLDSMWESLKTPIRQALLAGYAFLINLFLNYIFNLFTNFFGIEIEADKKVVITEKLMTYGIPIVWAIMSFLDNLLHQLGKKTGSIGLTYGLTPYLEKINNG